MSFVESASRVPGASGSKLSVLRVSRNVNPARITRQGAYDSPVFERFTERARRVVVIAQDEARALKHDYIGTEHVLLGLLGVEEGLASRVLLTFDVDAETVRARIVALVGEKSDEVGGQIPFTPREWKGFELSLIRIGGRTEGLKNRQRPFTPRAKKVLELSLRQALALGHNYIGTEHILLGLVAENEGVGARILGEFGLDLETIRNTVIQILTRPSRPEMPLRAPSEDLREALTAIHGSVAAAKEIARTDKDEERAAMIARVERLLDKMLDAGE
jgi:ATP-dependent Clp protease ATP-binding subunit ClpA